MITIKDVAEKACVSVTTVSRVLNNRGYIGDNTRKRVYKVMEELNYRPNELARSLLRKHTNVFGLILPYTGHPFFSRLLQSIEEHCFSNSYKVMVCTSNHEVQRENEYVELLKSNMVDGIIVCSRTDNASVFCDLELPIVTIERSIGDNIPSVCCDNFRGGVIATQHLIDNGCKKPAIISGNPVSHLPATLRQEAFKKTCEDNHIEYVVVNTTESQLSSLDYNNVISDLFRSHPDTDAVFASGDVIAAQVIQVCASLGKSVPEDVQIVGFDDIDVARLTTPKITTVAQPIEQMGAYAVDVLIKKVQGNMVPNQLVLPVHLVKRGTTK